MDKMALSLQAYKQLIGEGKAVRMLNRGFHTVANPYVSVQWELTT